ncbi:MAG: hypothetical protein V3S30_11490 [Thermoanaerobaculia bacterium]
MPTNYGRRLNQDEHLSPAVPEPPEADPDKPICGMEAWATARGCENGKLLPEGEVLEDQMATGLEGSEQGDGKSAGESRHGMESRHERLECQRSSRRMRFSRSTAETFLGPGS